MQKMVIEKIEAKHDPDLVKRLQDLGIYPGLEIEIVSKISFNTVTLIRFGATTIALNEEEFSCLHGH